MKAVVLEKLNDKCIVLAEDETMREIPAAGCSVGDVVDISAQLISHRARKRRWQRVAAVAAMLLIAFCGAFSYSTFTVSATVTTQGDAPIMYYLNHRGQVLRAEALNETGEDVMSSMGDIGRRPSLEETLSKTEAIMQEKGYLEEDEYLTYTTDKDRDGKADEKKTFDPAKAGSGNAPSKKEPASSSGKQKQDNTVENGGTTKDKDSNKNPTRASEKKQETKTDKDPGAGAQSGNDGGSEFHDDGNKNDGKQ